MFARELEVLGEVCVGGRGSSEYMTSIGRVTIAGFRGTHPLRPGNADDVSGQCDELHLVRVLQA